MTIQEQIQYHLNYFDKEILRLTNEQGCTENEEYRQYLCGRITGLQQGINALNKVLNHK